MENKKEQIKDFWNSSCHDYDEHMQNTQHYKAQEKLLNITLSYFHQPILDIASGTGFLVKKLKETFTEIHANDFSTEMTKNLIKELSDITITNDDAELLSSYKENSIHTIFCCNAFFYLQNRKDSMSRWSQILIPKGRIILFEEYPFINTQNQVFDKHTENLNSLVDPISPTEIKKIATENNFDLIFEEKTDIDNHHKLYALVFQKKY
ncbi:MAG: class I SAM-dependent methyltransferase [Candidatus Pacebacteria bacterium]|nr:class I SAM-dependent methyltransferase [Candidatus Paceibacterota bacterium]